jgi:hypothetical protein
MGSLGTGVRSLTGHTPRRVKSVPLSATESWPGLLGGPPACPTSLGGVFYVIDAGGPKRLSASD